MRAFIEVEWLESYGGAEYPPAPTRLLQAIIAATVDRHVELLKHLETRVPVIYATKDPAILEFAKFVPNNDEQLPHVNASSKRKYIVRRCDGALRVVFEYDIEAPLFSELTEAALAIHTLGISGDFVIAKASATADVTGLDRYELKKGGTIRLFTPVAGFIDSVFARYNTGSALRLQHSYFARNAPKRSYALFELTNPLPSERSSLLVSWVRHAASPILYDISGHGPHEKRLVIIPVVTQAWRDSMIRRVIISAPNEEMAREAEAKLAALHLTDEAGTDRGYLIPAEYDAVFADHLTSCKMWRSVTPIIGAYDNHDQRKRMRNISKMFSQAGLPAPTGIRLIPCRNDQFFVNIRHREFPRFNLEIEFAEPVVGPVLLGRGRFSGLGVFASVNR